MIIRHRHDLWSLCVYNARSITIINNVDNNRHVLWCAQGTGIRDRGGDGRRRRRRRDQRRRRRRRRRWRRDVDHGGDHHHHHHDHYHDHDETEATGPVPGRQRRGGRVQELRGARVQGGVAQGGGGAQDGRVQAAAAPERGGGGVPVTRARRRPPEGRSARRRRRLRPLLRRAQVRRVQVPRRLVRRVRRRVLGLVDGRRRGRARVRQRCRAVVGAFGRRRRPADRGGPAVGHRRLRTVRPQHDPTRPDPTRTDPIRPPLPPPPTEHAPLVLPATPDHACPAPPVANPFLSCPWRGRSLK